MHTHKRPFAAIGIFRLGFVIRVLSHPLISGFMSGASLIIASGQVCPPPLLLSKFSRR